MHYIKQKRSEIDKCNICGRRLKLTWDHVPPKAMLADKNIYANLLFSEEGIPSHEHYMKHFQNGIKYRTICADCNNNVIGRNDRDYKEFINEVNRTIEVCEKAFQVGIILPRSITVKLKINRVIRAICGHFLAMQTRYDEKLSIDENLRKYVLDDSLKFEKEKLFCWFYPYSTIVNCRDLVIKGKSNGIHPTGFVSVMSFCPLGFMISTKDESDCRLDDLGIYSTDSIDDEILIELHFDTIYYAGNNVLKHFAWPVNISDDDSFGALFAFGSEASMKTSMVGIS